MGTSNTVSLVCAIVTLIVTIVIGTLQIHQNKKMKEFEQRQDLRDETRHAEEINAKAVAYISKYYAVRGLIPLCAIAAMYNKLYFYSREMYREFCCFTPEVQNRILEYCGLDLRVFQTQSIDFYLMCLNELEAAIGTSFPEDNKDIFYDGGKYLLRSLKNYGPRYLPHRDSALVTDLELCYENYVLSWKWI